MSLRDSVHVLTRPHLKTNDDGALVHAPALLAELRAACTSNQGAQGGGTGGGGMVVNSLAVKIETDIKNEALNEHFEMTGKEYQGRIVDLIQSWSDLGGEWEPYLAKITLEWIDAIRAMLEAKRPPWRPSMPCPSCSQRFYGAEREPCIAVYYWDDEAEAIAPPSVWIAKCDGCGAEWNGDNLKWLRTASDTPEKDVARVG
jgi:hypothetical protein